jgi:hypothetical protein
MRISVRSITTRSTLLPSAIVADVALTPDEKKAMLLKVKSGRQQLASHGGSAKETECYDSEVEQVIVHRRMQTLPADARGRTEPRPSGTEALKHAMLSLK